jgi:sugar (pentulose or hexulose) kinase
MAYLLGIDGGTESIRAIVFDLDGRPTGSHASVYQTQFPKPSWAEQNPEDWWRCLGEAARGALKASGISAEQVIECGHLTWPHFGWCSSRILAPSGW